MTIPDDLMVIIFTYLSASTDRKQEPAWYARPTRHPLAVTFLLACERVCRQWKNLLRSHRMGSAWVDMYRRDFLPGYTGLVHNSSSSYRSAFFHAYYSRAARKTLRSMDVFPDAAFAASTHNPSWTYEVLFEARQKETDRWWPARSMGQFEWSVYGTGVTLYGTVMQHHEFYNMGDRDEFPESRSVVLGHESATYTNDYVPTPSLEGMVYLRRSDGACALLGRFDSSLVQADEKDGWKDECSDQPELYCAPFFVQPLIRNIRFGDRRYTLYLRVEVQYERNHPEMGGWFSDLELDLILLNFENEHTEIEHAHQKQMSRPMAKDAFVKALNATLQWNQ